MGDLLMHRIVVNLNCNKCMHNRNRTTFYSFGVRQMIFLCLYRWLYRWQIFKFFFLLLYGICLSHRIYNDQDYAIENLYFVAIGKKIAIVCHLRSKWIRFFCSVCDYVSERIWRQIKYKNWYFRLAKLREKSTWQLAYLGRVGWGSI